MVTTLIYLFESGMCLTLLFLVYYLFLRKETYFTFNRFYLISILILSFLLPLLHVKLTLPQSEQMENSVGEINKIKNYYENLIALTDPGYENSFTKPFGQSDSNEFEDGTNFDFLGRTLVNADNSEENISKIKTGFGAETNWARVLLTLYLLGILFFTIRLMLLIKWLNQIRKKYGSTNEYGVNLVRMDEEVPPFSFFRFVFMNKETASHSGFDKILTHEKVHISQRHSYDLLLAHTITIIQWFNPFAWLINNAMKTNHEYIADRNVVEQGHELFDYQSLLLKQIISIRSVELVNNFNLINIKKRIAMMTKIKSGLAAQIKALVVIPAAIIVFFFFAEVTFAQNAIGFQNKDLTKEIQGFWKNPDKNTYGQLLNFKGNEIQILENNDSYKDFTFDFKTSTVSMTNDFFEASPLVVYSKNINDWAVMMVNPENDNSKFFYVLLKDDKLYIVWNSLKASIYNRVAISNSLEYFYKEFDDDFTPVSGTYFRTIENSDKTFRLLMNYKGEMMMNNERVTFDNLREEINKIRTKGNPFDERQKIPVLMIDGACKMQNVNALYDKMREIDELRYVISLRPNGKYVSEVFYHNIGIPRLLPPKDAELMDEKEVEKSGMKIIRIDLTKGITPEQAAAIFKKEIQKDKKFVVLYIYENETTYQEYMSILDKFYLDIFAKRNALALEKYDLGFDDLANAHQKEIRKSFPMVITEQNIDQPEN